DLGAPLVVASVHLLDLEQLLADECVDPGGIAEDRAQLLDALAQILVLRLDLLPREAGEPREAEVEDRLRLNLRELEAIHELRAPLVGIRSSTDERDNRVDVVERLEVALENVRTRFGLAQLVLRAPRDDLALEVEIVAYELEERQRLRDAVDKRDRVVAER